MRTTLTALAALMLFATPVVAGDFEDGVAAYKAGDNQKAFRLWKSLAEQGDAGAQFNLGLTYATGQGVPENNVKAYVWISLATVQGDEDAKGDMGIVKKMMTREKIAKGQELAAKY